MVSNDPVVSGRSSAATLVLLPGLDGTDVFFQPLLASLPASITPLVVSYLGSRQHGYADLLEVVREKVAAVSECYVLGWSFSGPLALMLAAAEPEKVRGVILSASFVRAPRPALVALRFACVAPIVWTYRAARRLPLWLLKPRTDPLRRAKTATWARVSAAAVAARMRAALAVDARELLRACHQPLLYIAASEDTVVPRRNAAEIVRLRPSSRVATIAGHHLAMYCNPGQAAEIVVNFIAETNRAVAGPTGQREVPHVGSLRRFRT